MFSPTTWHDWLALSFVFAAAAVIAGRIWRAMFGPGKAGCGSGCGSCGSNRVSASKPDSLIAIGPPPEARRTDNR